MKKNYITIHNLLVNPKVTVPRYKTPLLTKKGVAVLFIIFNSNTFAETILYTGDGSKFVERPTGYPGIGASNDKGIIPVDGGIPSHSDNTVQVNVTSGANPDFILGGYVDGGTSNADITVKNNSIIFNAGTVNRYIYGGYIVSSTGKSISTANTVVLNGTTKVGEILYGGFTQAHSTSQDNAITSITSLSAVTLNDSTSTQGIRGGFIEAFGTVEGSTITATLLNNTVTLNDNATVSSLSARGAFIDTNSTGKNSTITAIANGNAVILNGNSKVETNIEGGYISADADAGAAIAATSNNNTVTLNNNATTNRDIRAGYIDVNSIGSGTIINADASANSVVLNDFAKVDRNIYGGYIIGRVTENGAMTTQANNNTITLNGNALTKRDIYGGYINVVSTTALDLGTVNGNVINLNNHATIGNNLYGGYIRGNATGDGAIKVQANNNTITLNDSATAKGDIYGGYVSVIGTTTTHSGTANGNTIGINDSATIERNLYGGYIDTAQTAMANNNTVNISGKPTFSATNSSIYGGYYFPNQTIPIQSNVFTDNTLNFTARSISVQNVANFEYYNFTLDPVLANSPTALITAETITLGANANNMSNSAGQPSHISVVGIHSGHELNADDEFILMQAKAMSGVGQGHITKGIAQQGISLLYDVQTIVDIANNRVTAVILGSDNGGDIDGENLRDKNSGNNGNSSGDNNGSGTNGENSSNGGTNGGNSGSGIGSRTGGARINPQLKAISGSYLSGLMLVTRGADLVADRTQEQQSGLTPFIISSGSYNRYNNDSNIKSKDFLLISGLSYQQAGLTLGAFIESGWGNYNSFSNTTNVRGEGNSRYYGLGLLGRYGFSNGFYADGSIHFGRARVKFNTQDIKNFVTHEYANYNAKTNYISTHLTGGYVFSLNDTNSFDLSAKYLWSKMGSQKLKIAGDDIHFDRVNSSRLRINAIYKHQYNTDLTLSAGLGYEYEFDSKARLTTYNRYMDGPSIKGSTGILSLGTSMTPTANKNLTLDFKAMGYAGQRKGGSLSIQMQYHF